MKKVAVTTKDYNGKEHTTTDTLYLADANAYWQNVNHNGSNNSFSTTYAIPACSLDMTNIMFGSIANAASSSTVEGTTLSTTTGTMT